MSEEIEKEAPFSCMQERIETISFEARPHWEGTPLLERASHPALSTSPLAGVVDPPVDPPELDPPASERLFRFTVVRLGLIVFRISHVMRAMTSPISAPVMVFLADPMRAVFPALER